MENFEPSLSNESKKEVPPNLDQALYGLAHNGTEAPLINFINEFGVQEPYEISNRQRMHLRRIMTFNLEQIEKSLKYDRAIYGWKLLKKAGLLTPDSLKKEVEYFINGWMAASQESRELVSGAKGEYDTEFRREFAADLQQEIEKELDWQINIDVTE